MQTDRLVSYATRALQRGQVVSMRTRGRPWRVSCLGGSVWVTASGLAVDAVLFAGQDAVFGGRRRIVVEALGDSTVHLEPRAPVRPRQSGLVPRPARV